MPSNEEIQSIYTGKLTSGVPGESWLSYEPEEEFVLIQPKARTEQGVRVQKIMAEAMDLFVNKNAGYGEPQEDDLGAKGQYADMHRKWKRIRPHLWENEPWDESGESFEEVLMDLIGHIALTIDFCRRGE